MQELAEADMAHALSSIGLQRYRQYIEFARAIKCCIGLPAAAAPIAREGPASPRDDPQVPPTELPQDSDGREWQVVELVVDTGDGDWTVLAPAIFGVPVSGGRTWGVKLHIAG